MTFTGLPFVILLLVTYPLWLLCRGRYWPTLCALLGASLVFYGHDEWPLVFLLGAYCVVDWATGRWIATARRPALPLALGVTFNLTVLAYWKYTPMLLRTLAPLWEASGGAAPFTPPVGWGIPFGISFYSFTGIAYMVAVYRRTTPVETNLARCALNLSFFPHLMAGPILRAEEFLVALRPGRLPASPLAPREAALLLARGYFKKMVLADRIALAIDPYFLHAGTPATAGVWALPYLCLYSFQIYFDFSGYTDIARGLALWFGFRWPDNFNLPYLADSPREFWRRWHMTLSRFLRDYVYIPLGGNRHGRWRGHGNVMLTMLLGGIWHGSSWSFLLWGGLHGSYVVAHRLWMESGVSDRLRCRAGAWRALGRPLAVALTFTLVTLTWAFFRLTDLDQSLVCLRNCVIFEPSELFAGGSGDPAVWALLAVYGLTVWLARWAQASLAAADPGSRVRLTAAADGFAWGTAAAVLLLAVLLAPSGETPPFIYFQF